MCRLVGVVASETTNFRFCLRDAPRSLSTLSPDHPDGWGVGVHDGERWAVDKEPSCAREDAQFASVSATRLGRVLVAHVRKRTVGAIGRDNTHPFERGRWTFAHNGTIDDEPFLRARTSAVRLAEIVGQTDTELFFAYLLTAMDALPEAHDDALARALRSLVARAGVAANFLLSDGDVLYAHRFGRSLYTLRRVPGDAVRTERTSLETLATLETPWTERRSAVLVASERLSDEPWEEVPEGTLLRVDRRPLPALRVLGSTLPP
jgi:glutamine amidotransferase